MAAATVLSVSILLAMIESNPRLWSGLGAEGDLRAGAAHLTVLVSRHNPKTCLTDPWGRLMQVEGETAQKWSAVRLDSLQSVEGFL